MHIRKLGDCIEVSDHNATILKSISESLLFFTVSKGHSMPTGVIILLVTVSSFFPIIKNIPFTLNSQNSCEFVDTFLNFVLGGLVVQCTDLIRV